LCNNLKTQFAEIDALSIDDIKSQITQLTRELHFMQVYFTDKKWFYPELHDEDGHKNEWYALGMPLYMDRLEERYLECSRLYRDIKLLYLKLQMLNTPDNIDTYEFAVIHSKHSIYIYIYYHAIENVVCDITTKQIQIRQNSLLHKNITEVSLPCTRFKKSPLELNKAEVLAFELYKGYIRKNTQRFSPNMQGFADLILSDIDKNTTTKTYDSLKNVSAFYRLGIGQYLAPDSTMAAYYDTIAVNYGITEKKIRELRELTGEPSNDIQLQSTDVGVFENALKVVMKT
jgi:hypothetical protein